MKDCQFRPYCSTRPILDVPLDLGAIVRSVYERGAFGTRIDYRQPVPAPALDEDDQVWVDQLLDRIKNSSGNSNQS